MKRILDKLEMHFPGTTREAGRFLVVGGLGTALNYGIFFLLFWVFGVHYVASSIIGYVTGVILGYTFNRAWTFPPAIKSRTREFSFYVGIYLLSLTPSLIVLRTAVEVIGINPLLANVLAIATSTISNFLGLKFVVFNKRVAEIF